MDIDYVFASAIFFLFVVWALFSYSNLFQANNASGLEMAADRIMGIAAGSVTAEVNKIPIVYEAVSEENNSVIYADFPWEGQESSAKVLLNGTKVDCMLNESRVYWKTDLQAGQNVFTLEFGHFETPMQCDSAFSTENATKTDMLAIERKWVAVQGLIDSFLATDYNEFRADNGIAENFRVEFNQSGNISPWGVELPVKRDVAARRAEYLEYLGSESVQIRVLVWE